MYLTLLVFSSLYARSDNLNNPDSINKVLALSSDSLKLDLLIKSANEYNNINNDLSIEFAKIAESLAKKLNIPQKQVSAQIIIGKAYYNKGDYSNAIEQTEKAQELATSINDSIHFIDIYQNYSLIYSKLGDFKKALDYSQLAFSLVGRFNQQSKLADLVRETGNIYFSFGESTIALDFYQKSLNICKEAKDEEGMSKALNNIGRIYSENKQFSKALEFLNKSLEIKYKHDNKLGIANTLLNIGTIYLRQEKYTLAVDHFKQAISFYSKVSFNEGISNAYQYLGNTYLKSNDFQESEESFNTALEIAEKNKFKPLLVTITLGQSELYAKMTNYKTAYEKFLEYKILRDSVFSSERRTLLMELDAKYRLQSKEKQIQFLSKDQELKDAQRKKLIFWIAFLIAAALFLVSLTYFIYSRMRFKNKLNIKLVEEISQRKIIEAELQRHQEHLEALVDDRTKDLKIAKDKAEESDMLKTAFLANMSHEIRTPMNAIVGFSNLLLDPESTQPEKEEYIHLINSNSDNLMNLINDIIDISIIEAGQIKITKSTVCIFDTLEELRLIFDQELFKVGKSQIDLKVEYNLSDPLVSLTTDKNRFKQIFSNLISNAIKFTNNGSVIFGVKGLNSNSFTFYVKDTGVGIPECNRESIFDRFSKFNTDDDSKLFSGTGLGLALCREIIELLGGNIWLESKVGEGSVFYFTLPHLISGDNIDLDISYVQETPSSFDFKDKTVIIAEDVVSNYQLLRAYLFKTGINIVWAKNGSEVINYLTNNKNVDLILMDVQMPVMDGIKTIEVIRSTGNKVPVIVQTAFALTDEIEKCFNAGCNDYIVKPIRKEELMNIIYSYLS